MRKYALLEFFKCLSLRRASITKGPVRLYEHTKSYLYRNVIYCNKIAKDVPYQHVTKFVSFPKTRKHSGFPKSSLLTFRQTFPLYDVHFWYNAGAAGDVGLIPGSGRSPGQGHGDSLQYSCLGNPTEIGVWWATVHGFAKTQS